MMAARNVHVRIGGKSILTDVSITARCGQVSTLLGPNGAGKSTLLRCLTGVVRPDRGDVVLDGRPLSDYSLTSLARRRAVLSQSNPVNFPFTAYEIIMMGRNPYFSRHCGANDRRIVNHVLRQVDAYSLKDRVFQELSGGEQQRVQVARVLAQIWETERPYLFMDEPTVALDLKHQHQTLQLVRMLAEEKEWAVIIVIHDLHLAKRYGDNAVFMKHGRIYDHGAVFKILNPENVAEVFEIPRRLSTV